MSTGLRYVVALLTVVASVPALVSACRGGRTEPAGPLAPTDVVASAKPSVEATSTAVVVPRDPPSGVRAGPGPAPDAAARIAVFLASCLPDQRVGSGLSNIYAESGGTRAIDRAIAAKRLCLADKTNGCAAVEECLGLRVDRSGPCAPSCKGQVFEACDGAARFRFDCGKLGLSCSLAERGCATEPAPPACTRAAFRTRCDEGAPVDCLNGEVRGPRCSDHGLVCGAAPDGGMACRGTGRDCKPTSYNHVTIDLRGGTSCAGDNLYSCVNGGEHVTKCAQMSPDFKCRTREDQAFCGLGDACSPETPDGAGTAARCDGDRLVVCNAGRLDTIDCRSLGFGGCAAGVCVAAATKK